MNLQIRQILLLFIGFIYHTYSHGVLVFDDSTQIHNDLRRLKLSLESIVTKGSLEITDVITFPAKRAVGKDTSLNARFSRIDPPPSSNVSDLCLNHLSLLAEALRRKEEWAIRFIDAMGKIGSGILDGNLIWPGSYDECIDTQAVVYADPVNKSGSSYPYMGQYCKASIPLSLSQRVTVGICLPETCNEDDAVALVRRALSMLLLNNTGNINTTVECHDRDRSFDDRAIAVTIIASSIAATVVLGTVYDVITTLFEIFATEKKMANFDDSLPAKNTHNNGIVVQILLAFSMYSNANKILNTKQADGSLNAVNGIRCLSMFWVILGHTYSFGLGFASNIGSFLPKMLNRFTFQAISNATVSVDSFFFLSGLLLAFVTFRELKKAGGIKEFSWGKFYFHRFWRLTPPYMLLMMLYIPTIKYWSDGPFWLKDGIETDYCKDTWWTNLIYINNFVDTEKMCMIWSWYLANDMQFFVVSPVLLIALYISPFIGSILSGVFFVASFMTSGIIASVNNIEVYTINQAGNNGNSLISMKPYCRMGPYIVGILTGYILFKTDCKVKIHRVLNITGWLIATGLALSVLYGLYNPNNEKSMSIGVSALYLSTARSAWSMALAWVVFSCATDHGGFVNTILSWNVYVPLGRLTYCAYLIHPLIIYFYYYSLRTTIVFNDLTISYLFVGHLVLAYAAAFILSLVFEAPMMALEKVLFRRDRRN